MRRQALEARTRIAERLAARVEIGPVRYSDQVAGYWERDIWVLLVEGSIAGRARKFGYWIPITRKAYRDSRVRAGAESMARKTLPSEIVKVLVDNPNIIGPRGVLPA